MNSMVNNESFIGTLWGYCNDSLAERNFKNIELYEPKIAEKLNALLLKQIQESGKVPWQKQNK